MKRKEFKYKEELNKRIKNFKMDPALAPYEVIKNDERYKVFAEFEDFIKYVFFNEEDNEFTIVWITKIKNEQIDIHKRNLYESELRYMAEKANLI